MKLFKRIILAIVVVLLCLVVFAFSYLYLHSTGTTPSIKDDQGNVIKNSIAEMRYVKIGGVEQFVLIRGKDIDNPLLLILHGGPGVPELPMYREHNSDLENYFTVVYWDQRGAGKSAVDSLVEKDLTLDQFVEDAHELTGYLKTQFKKEKIFLLGHSWGSLLGVSTVNKYPNDYYAYVGTGQVGNQPKSEALAYHFGLQKARESNDTVAQKALADIGEFSSENISKVGLMEWVYTQRVHVSMFGGSTYRPDGAMDVFILPLLFCNEYSIGNKYAFIKSNDKSMFVKSPFRNLMRTVIATDLSKTVSEFKVPVYILQGQNDYLTNYSVAKEYFDSLKAPKKIFVTFEKSAHFPAFEEPKKFNDIMINQVLKDANVETSKELKK
jgi:pimeloyl-ACP methyl ester carboxylesterase